MAGKVSLDLAKLVAEMECSKIERKLPITLNVNGVVIEATLYVSSTGLSTFEFATLELPKLILQWLLSVFQIYIFLRIPLDFI